MITITPGPMELGLNREPYEDVVAQLRAEGYDARLDAPEEFRGGRPIEIVADVVVTIAEQGYQEIAALVAGYLIAKLKDVPLRGRRKGGSDDEPDRDLSGVRGGHGVRLRPRDRVQPRAVVRPADR
jgi:hypothetical protein